MLFGIFPWNFGMTWSTRYIPNWLKFGQMVLALSKLYNTRTWEFLNTNLLLPTYYKYYNKVVLLLRLKNEYTYENMRMDTQKSNIWTIDYSLTSNGHHQPLMVTQKKSGLLLLLPRVCPDLKFLSLAPLK